MVAREENVTALAEAQSVIERGDIERGVALFEALIEDGSAHASLMLGQMYELGKGVARDDGKAEALYRQSKKLGSPTGAYYLARFLETATKPEAAFVEMHEITQRGYLPAINQLGYYYENGIGCVADLTAAAHYRAIAAERGHIFAKRWIAGRDMCSRNLITRLKGCANFSKIILTGILLAARDPTNERLI